MVLANSRPSRQPLTSDLWSLTSPRASDADKAAPVRPTSGRHSWPVLSDTPEWRRKVRPGRTLVCHAEMQPGRNWDRVAPSPLGKGGLEGSAGMLWEPLQPGVGAGSAKEDEP